jgi:hypothetical protein
LLFIFYELILILKIIIFFFYYVYLNNKMTKDVLSKLLMITLAGALVYFIFKDYNGKKVVITTTEEFNPDSELLKDTSVKVEASDEKQNEKYRAVDFESKQYQNDCFPRDKLDASDLLPKDAANSQWSQVATNSQGSVGDQNFLTAGYQYGINTQSGSLRNANLSIRSEPINSKEMVSPWLNSTISPDLNRRPLEIGSGEC